SFLPFRVPSGWRRPRCRFPRPASRAPPLSSDVSHPPTTSGRLLYLFRSGKMGLASAWMLLLRNRRPVILYTPFIPKYYAG
ncbi:unnamed protein product, partial [Musa textilis]